MSARCYNWTPGEPVQGINGADLDSQSVKNAALSGIATTKLQGTVTNAQLAGSITSDKLSKPRNVFVLGPISLATVAAQTGLAAFQAYGALTILEVGMNVNQNGTAASTIIDVHRGTTTSRANSSSIFGGGTKLKLKAASNNITKVAAPSGSLGTVADDGGIWIDVDAAASGTKSNLSVWLVCKQYPVA